MELPSGVIKDGRLEHPLGMEVSSWQNHEFLWSIFQHAIVDYQRVYQLQNVGGDVDVQTLR